MSDMQIYFCFFTFILAAPYGPPPIIHMQGPMNYGGGEEGKIDNTFVGWSGFSDKAIRAIFVRKVNSYAY